MRERKRNGGGGSDGNGKGWQGSNGSNRKVEEDGRSDAEEWKNERKGCGAHDVSVAEAACLPQLLLAPHPTTSHRVLRKTKDKDIASLCTRAPFPLFIYLCPSTAGNACPPVFSLAFRYSIVGQFTLALERFSALKAAATAFLEKHCFLSKELL